jgi:hypothetical protein
MDKFWDWMLEKKYSNMKEFILSPLDYEFIFAEKQMLIGYMIEYMLEFGGDPAYRLRNARNINEAYELLKNRIEEMI